MDFQKGIIMERNRLMEEKDLQKEIEQKPGKPESDDWYTLALEDMEEFIESQGVYLRQ